MKGPPSIGQLVICGSWDTVVWLDNTGAKRVGIGKDRKPAVDNGNRLFRSEKTLAGLALNLTAVFTGERLFLKMYRLRSIVPNKLDVARNGVPITFSKKSAGPPIL